MLPLGAKVILCQYFYIYCPTYDYLHTVLLSIRDFRKNRGIERCNFYGLKRCCTSARTVKPRDF